MYKITYIDNCKDRKNYDIYEKKIELKEEAKSVYSEMFALVKASMLEEFDELISINPDIAPVMRQIKEVIEELKADDEIELKAQEVSFLIMNDGKLEFAFLNRHIVLKIEEE